MFSLITEDSSRSVTPQMCFIPTYILSSTTAGNETSRKSNRNKQLKDENYFHKSESKSPSSLVTVEHTINRISTVYIQITSV